MLCDDEQDLSLFVPPAVAYVPIGQVWFLRHAAYHDENPALTARIRIRSVMTRLILKGGSEIERMLGVRPIALIA